MARNQRSGGNGEPVQEKRRPVYSRRFYTGTGTIEAAVWMNPGEGDEDRPRYSITTSRSYKDGEEYKRSDNYWPQDVPALALALQDCAFWIADQMAKRQA